MNLTSDNITVRKLPVGQFLAGTQKTTLDFQKIENFIKAREKEKIFKELAKERELKITPVPFSNRKSGLQKKIERHLQLVSLAKSQARAKTNSQKSLVNEISAKLIEESLDIEKRVRTNIQVHSLVLDWFGANLKGEIPQMDEGIWFEVGDFSINVKKGRIKGFEKLAYVLHNGKDFGEIRYKPIECEFIEKNTVMFKAANSMLYQNDFYELFEKFQNTLSLNFSHLNKIDLAADGTGFMKPLILADQGKIDWTNKRGKFQPFKKNGRIGLEYEGFWLGSKAKGDKYGRCYLKKQEIAISGKTYIENFWRENDLFEKVGTTSIERLEFSLRNKEIAKYFSHDLTWTEVREKLEKPSFLASLFHTVSKSLYQFREKRKTGLENVTRLKKYFSLDFSCWSGVSFLDAVINIGTKRIRSFKTSCKVMFEVGLKTGIDFYEKTAVEFATNINHMAWFRKSKERWRDEFDRSKRKCIEYIPIFTPSFISSSAGKFFKDVTQYKTQDETQIDKILNFFTTKKYEI